MPLTTTFTSNSPTPAPPSTVGFKLSKPNYDANTAAGSNMLFDSSWPSLAIAFDSGSITNLITSTSSFMTIAHNLGFAGFAIGWAYFPDPSGVGNVCSRFMPMVDTSNVYINGNDIYTNRPPYNATKIIIRVFQLDLSKDVDYALAPGASYNQPYDINYGVKVVKPNKDINSKDMRNFALHSRCQSPLVLAVKTQLTSAPANPNTVQYVTGLSYPSWVYGYIKVGSSIATGLGVPINTFKPAPYYSAAYPATKTDGITSYLTYNTGASADNGATLVILRDPMFAATQLTVQY